MKNQKRKILTPQDVAYSVTEIAAMKALFRGEASGEQQKHALTWIIHEACGTYKDEYRTDPRDHARLSGKRSVGLLLVDLVNTVLVNTGKENA